MIKLAPLFLHGFKAVDRMEGSKNAAVTNNDRMEESTKGAQTNNVVKNMLPLT